MEVIEGVNPIDFFNKATMAKGFQEEKYYRYFFQKIAKAMHELHKKGVAHRDIKLENMMLTPEYKIKLVDYGFGIPLSGQTGSYFMDQYVGTSGYMAPELEH